MCDIYRVFECRAGLLFEIVFLQSEKAVWQYLKICRDNNTEPDTFYFAQKLRVEA